jgi:hypothetical protein
MSVTRSKVPKKPLRKNPAAKKLASHKPKLVKNVPATNLRVKKTVTKKLETKTRAVKKPLPKKQTSKPKDTAKPVAKKRSTQAVPAKPTTSNITLPTRMSIRAREKVLVLAEALELRTHRPAYALTMTFGMLFVVFGSFVGFNEISFESNCDDGICSLQQTAELSASLTPTVTLMAPLPSTIQDTFQIIVSTEHLTTLNVYLEAWDFLGKKLTTNVPISALSGARYSLTIPGSELAPNNYTLLVDTYINQQKKSTITLGQFRVAVGGTVVGTPSSTQSAPVVPLTSTTNSLPASYSGASSSASSASQSGPAGTTNQVTNSQSVQVSSLSEVVGSDIITTSTTTTETTSDINGVATTTTTQAVVQTQATLELAKPNAITLTAGSMLSGMAAIRIDTSSPQPIAIYLRRVQGTEQQLAGRAQTGAQTFMLNTRNFPNGTYELFAKSLGLSNVTKSNSLRITISNPTEQMENPVPLTSPIINEEREVLRITRDVIAPAAPLQTQSPQSNLTETATALQRDASSPIGISMSENFDLQEPIRQRALEKLADDTDTLDALFTRFAVAIQSGDVDLIREARQAITNYQRLIVERALANEEDRFIADDLSLSLEAELEQIAKKVETFESLRRERLEGSSSTDTDGDGITDTDERVLFGTDPLKADTDGDGFTDGVEIIKGFDPLNAASEAVIAYRSPRETVGITANENLQVTEVIPAVQLTNGADETNESIVQATVRGRALANSFVTLYIFSTPTVVTVRTEADGSFEYTFSKELEDGQHQVFVALTDNTGDIVAQSAPFTFIKQAEAFTEVDAESIVSGSQSGMIQSNQTFAYQTVLSMSVLALGILLILLGIGLRANRPEELIADSAA